MANGGGPIDLTKPDDGGKVAVTVSPYSAAWAGIVRPVTKFLFSLLAAVLLIPFLFVFVEDRTIQLAALDWAKTILAPTVGFASAAVGYYYGTRAASGGDNADPGETT